MTTFLDANLLHDIVTGKSVNPPPPNRLVQKRQATVETATYASEFAGAKTTTEQIMDPSNTVKYLGVPIMTKAYMFDRILTYGTLLDVLW